jgi:uncharacterized damage-inducible protein DinB
VFIFGLSTVNRELDMHLQSILRGAHAYLEPSKALAGITTDVAHRKPPNAPHSIAEIVAHMAFWQQWFLDRCEGLSVRAPERAALGWPAVADGEWETILARFETGFRRGLALANDQARAALPLTPALEFDHLRNYTTSDVLIHVALHNAHHAGQVVTLRQQQGAWPPPAGSWTW